MMCQNTTTVNSTLMTLVTNFDGKKNHNFSLFLVFRCFINLISFTLKTTECVCCICIRHSKDGNVKKFLCVTFNETMLGLAFFPSIQFQILVHDRSKVLSFQDSPRYKQCIQNKQMTAKVCAKLKYFKAYTVACTVNKKSESDEGHFHPSGH